MLEKCFLDWAAHPQKVKKQFFGVKYIFSSTWLASLANNFWASRHCFSTFSPLVGTHGWPINVQLTHCKKRKRGYERSSSLCGDLVIWVVVVFWISSKQFRLLGKKIEQKKKAAQVFEGRLSLFERGGSMGGGRESHFLKIDRRSSILSLSRRSTSCKLLMVS